MPDEFQAEPPRRPLPHPNDRDDPSAADNPFRKPASRSPVVLAAVVGGILLFGCGGLFVFAAALLFWRSGPAPPMRAPTTMPAGPAPGNERAP